MRKNYDDHADAPSTPSLGGYIPCNVCRSPTLRSMLEQHGGRCLSCHDTWCRSGPCGTGDPPSGFTLTKADTDALLAKMTDLAARIRTGPIDGRAWAARLQEREKSGEPLSIAQRAMWRAAMRAPVNEPLQKGSHTFLDEELPPGMRKGPVDPEAVQRLEQHVRAKLGYGISERAPDADHIPGLT